MRKISNSIVALVGISVLSLAGAARASVLEQFNFQGQAGDEATATPSTPTSGVSASGIARGPNLTPIASFSTNAYGNYPSNNSWPGSAAGAESAGDYDSFSLTPLGGDSVSLSEVTYAFMSQNGIDPTYGNPNFNATLEYSLDDLTFTPITSQMDVGTAGQDNSPIIASVDASGVTALQGVTTPIYFRIDLYNIGGYQPGGIGSSAGGTNDLVVNGSVAAATPEPASIGLAAVGAIGMLGRRRRRA